MTALELPPGRWFHPSEFACKDGTPYPVEFAKKWLALRDLCDQIRDIFGAPLRVVSGYRTLTYNAKLARRSELHQVASGSAHCMGMAADLAPKRRDEVRLLHSYVLAAWKDGKLPTLGGLGSYSGWIHVDLHRSDDGHLRRWVGK